MNHPRHRRVALVAGLVLAFGVALPASAAPSQVTYRVTITTLTDGQPLTPPLVAVHRGNVDLFTVGAPASFGIKEIAENGNLDPLVMDLDGRRGVGALHLGGEPLVPLGSPGETVLGFTDRVTFTISAPRNARFLSWASMLICTNDGFTGVDRLRLPRREGSSVSRLTAGYDAGTERNTEAFADIVPPCQGLIGVTGDPGTGASDPALAEGGVIQHHPGIMGGADLVPAVHGWDDPVARIVVTLLDDDDDGDDDDDDD